MIKIQNIRINLKWIYNFFTIKYCLYHYNQGKLQLNKYLPTHLT